MRKPRALSALCFVGLLNCGTDGQNAVPDMGNMNTGPATFTDTVSMFHLNVQDYGYLADSAEIVGRVIDLFETNGLRLDVYLTTWMVDEYQAKYPALLQRILTHPNISVSYHTRPPKPYRASFTDRNGQDWYGLYAMDAQKQYDEIKLFESFGVDLVSGQRTASEGGFVKLTRLYGRAPYVGGIEADSQAVQAATDRVFKDLGLTFVVAHGRVAYEGDLRNGIRMKPEVIDAKIFNSDPMLDGDTCVALGNGRDIYDCEMARCASSAKRPCTVALKMHDNDFFADASWWLTVYNKTAPPWDPNRRAAKLSDSAKAAMWTRYEQIVHRAAEMQSTYATVGAKDWAARIK